MSLPQRTPLRVVALLAAALAAGCSRKVDEDQCRELVGKLTDLLVDEGKDTRPDADLRVGKAVTGDPRAAKISKETCVGKISRSQYECMMAAKNLEGFLACDR